MGLATQFGRPGASFYDGTPGRTLVKCRDCGHPADELFGDHGGDCIGVVEIVTPSSALGIIRAHALRRQHFSMNDLREAFVKAGIAKGSRAGALNAAQKRGWIEADGTVASTDPKTKRHRLQTYRSLIYGQHADWSRR